MKTHIKNNFSFYGYFLLLWALMTMAAIAVEPAAPAAALAPTKEEELIAKMVQAYGGKDALAKVRSLYTKGNQHVYQLENDGWVTRYWQRPGKMRIESATRRAQETRVLNGSKAWMAVRAGALKPAPPAHYQGMVFQYDAADLPFFLNENRKAAVYQGQSTVDGIAYQVLLVKKGSGQGMTAYIDEQSGLISRVSGSITVGNKPAAASLEFSEYRDVDGVKVPYKIVTLYGAAKASEIRMSEVVVNKDMADTLFNP